MVLCLPLMMVASRDVVEIRFVLSVVHGMLGSRQLWNVNDSTDLRGCICRNLCV